MRERKKTKPVAVEEILNQFFKERKKAGKSLESRIIDQWPEIIPQEAQEHTKPITIKNKTLIIAVSNSAWLYQLTLKKAEILKAVKNLFNSKDIEDIRFKIGK